MSKAIAVFNSNHDALLAEKLLKQNQIRVRPIIKPRKISSTCTLALEFGVENLQKVMEISISNKLLLAGIHQKRNEEWVVDRGGKSLTLTNLPPNIALNFWFFSLSSPSPEIVFYH